MKKYFYNRLSLFLWFLAGINFLLFVSINFIPINWTNTELFTQAFLWSSHDIDDLRFRLGVQWQDFLKPLNVYRIDGFLRLRPVSSLLEMLSFKFWQYWGWEGVFFRNYTVALLHFINVLLLGRVVADWTNNRYAGWIAAVSFLNCGVAVATIVYPFRLAKILLMTFFLLQCLCLMPKHGGFKNSSWLRFLTFWGLLLLSVFTDEMSLFTTLCLFVMIGFREGWRGLWNRRMILASSGAVIMIIGMAIGLIDKAYQFPGIRLESSATVGYFHNLQRYFLNLQTYSDLTHSFFVYFLRRNFGHWDGTFWGVLALLSALIFVGLIRKYRISKRDTIFIISLGMIMVLKVVLLPHMKPHPYIMPEGTVFPSLLFFSYYYVYFEALLLSFVIGVLCSQKDKVSDARIIVLVVILTVINISNVYHLQKGPENALAISRFDQEYRRGVIEDIHALTKIIKATDKERLYLSFPGSNQDQLNGMLYSGHPNMTHYEHIIHSKYLRLLSEGKVKTSYKNVSEYFSNNDLLDVDLFYDVQLRRLFDLNILRRKLGREALHSRSIPVQGSSVVLDKTLTRPIKNVIFFLKGPADFKFQTDQAVITREQIYLGSYEHFRIQFDSEEGRYPTQVNLTITPRPEASAVELIGPFLFYEDVAYERHIAQILGENLSQNNISPH